MKHKQSIFNFLYERSKDEHILYNTFSKALVSLDDDEFLQYEMNQYHSEILENDLIQRGILIEEKFDELLFMKFIHYQSKFSKNRLFLTIAPTLDCNFACPYCYENRRQGKMNQEVQDAIVAYIDNVISNGTKFIDISWYGGEPLLYPDIVESLGHRIKNLCQEKDCSLKMHMVTNGYLFTPEIIEMIDDIGVTKVQITLDGLKERHDVSRPLRGGGGTFDRVMSNRRLFDDSPIEVVIRMNVDNRNYADFFLLKKAIALIQNPNIEIYASPVEDINPDTKNEVSQFMTTQEFDKFVSNACDEGGLCASDFDVMDDRFCFCTSETELCYVVDDRGDCYKCWDEVGRTEYRCFNILKPDDVNSMQLARYLADDPFSNDKCSKCVFLPLCFGGCKFQRAHLNKSVCGFNREMMIKYLETAFF